ncbi:hypothetical protein HHI36_015658 [Cryptolaemus montrouzieri]|uniref:Uncharacterized protein n=1 Tax=Cryptolaemus montrouzieri TaxID=559131 RepID=A0ABD2N6F4_9CUCU
MLKRRSPLSVIIDKFNRRGEHKVCGDIFKSLMAMQKMSIFHEVTSHLPEEDRSKLSETIHQLQIAKTRRLHSKKWSTTLPSIQRTSTFTSRDLLQKYTPTEESAGIREKEKYRHTVVTETNTLMRNCRALRLKEDSVVVPFQNDSKIKTLLRKSESFKY